MPCHEFVKMGQYQPELNMNTSPTVRLQLLHDRLRKQLSFLDSSETTNRDEEMLFGYFGPKSAKFASGTLCRAGASRALASGRPSLRLGHFQLVGLAGFSFPGLKQKAVDHLLSLIQLKSVIWA